MRARPGDYRVIVIGSGMAGLFAALEARALGPVLVLTKAAIGDGNTSWAQGGIAAATDPGDSPADHLADTIAAGAGLVDEAMARILVTEAPGRIRDLERYGVAFDREDGERARAREAAHGRARVLHARGDQTGAAVAEALTAAVADGAIDIREHVLARQIVLERGGVTGVEAFDARTGRSATAEAPAVIVATGGAGQLYSHTTNPPVTTGDGIALAFEAGAELGDLEFFQFHPTAFRAAGAPPFLISEAMRGEGAVLRNAAGEAFMPRYHDLADLAPRDVVARAIVTELRATDGDHVWLDATAVEGVGARFPAITAFCREQGIDAQTQPIPVAPAAHYLMGGVRTDGWGRTTVPGLYACGEAAATGVHGANRLASNSLLETVVFAKRAIEHLAGGEGGAAAPSPDAQRISDRGGPPPDRATLQTLMWERAGIERDGESLAAALSTAEGWPEHPSQASRQDVELQAMGTLARLMLRAALQRTESRGAHHRTDYPCSDDANWSRRQVFRREP